MMLSEFQVWVLNPATGAVIAMYDDAYIRELQYSRSLNDIGTLAMTLPSTLDVRSSFPLDAFIEVYREWRGIFRLEETYLCRLTHRFIDGDEELFVIGGVSLNHLLTRRIVDPDDDPLVAGGYSTKSGPADLVIYGYCYEQAGPGASIPRRIPGLTIAMPPGVGKSVGTRLRHENLFTQIQSLSKNGHVDFRIVRMVGAQLEMRMVVVGQDKTYTTNAPLSKPWVGLTPLRGNLTKPSLVSDRKEEGNFVYALGQGQRDKRLVYKAAGSGVTDSPFNRCEFSTDVRQAAQSDVLALITGGDAALLEHILQREFTYEPTGTEPGNEYPVDWDLGDAVTIDWDEESRDVRITQIEVSISSSGETITVTTTDNFVFPGM